MARDTSLLNTHHYKVWIKGKMEQSRERSSALPLHLGVVAIEKWALELPSTMVANFFIHSYGWNSVCVRDSEMETLGGLQYWPITS